MTQTITYCEALRTAVDQEMRRDESIIVMGEDIGVYGGAFGVTRGLLEKYGSSRVIDTPISESSFVGAAVGAAMTGCRPVVEIMFMDFVTLVMDQMVNQAAKLHYILGQQAICPMVLRTAAGGGRSYGPTHSQSLEAWFMHVPGIKVAAPATPSDAAGLLKTAIRDDNPVLFLEHKQLYSQRQSVAKNVRPIPFGKAKRVVAGSDLTIVAYSWMAVEAIRAAAELAEAGIHAEVLDLRTLCPLDIESISESVKRTGRVLIVEEGTRTGGVSGEIGFQLFEAVFDYLDAPIKRVAAEDVPIPAAAELERAVLPNSGDIVAAARELVAL